MSLFRNMYKAPAPVVMPVEQGMDMRGATQMASILPLEDVKEEDFPTLWKTFFTSAEDIPLRVGTPEEAVFHVLSAGPKDAQITFFMMHGAGHSAMTFALLARYMTDKEKVRVITYDMRGHGYTTSKDETNMSCENLVEDALAVADAVIPAGTHVVLLGHSMGGSIAVHTALKAKGHFTLSGLVVVDIVEGSAVAALPSMNRIIDSMPSSFNDISSAVAYGMTSGSGSQSGLAARVTIPARLKKEDDHWVWRTDMRASEPYWLGWFQGLSEDFLSVPCAKFLMLAGRDNLDTPLTIGQMQGKFQIKFFPECGHLIQEDAPTDMGDALLSFALRYAIPVKLPTRFL